MFVSEGCFIRCMADVLSSWRAKMFLTSPRPWMLAKASGMAAVTEVMANRPASSCEGLMMVLGCPVQRREVGSRARETDGGCGAEECCGAGSATGACWRVNKRRDGLRKLVGRPFSYQKTSD